MFNIIEDCSPYYVRFTHSGIEEISNYCKPLVPKYLKDGFTHYKLPQENVKHLLNICPISHFFKLNTNRVSLFITNPGVYYRAHKDGLVARFSINYTVDILDDKCITSWYSDDDLSSYEIDNLPGLTSRECKGFVKAAHKPLKTMVAKPNECILFNTDIFHDWDNTNSKNLRVVLTLRLDPSLLSSVYFEDAKNKLFGV